MRLLGGVGAGLVAAVFAAIVLADLVVSLAGLWGGAGWYALVVLAFPAFIAFAAWRGWGNPPYARY